MGVSFFSFSFSMVSLSSLRSSLVPTRMMGVFGQWCLTSGYHWTHKTYPIYHDNIQHRSEMDMQFQSCMHWAEHDIVILRSKALIISARLVLPYTSGNKALTFARTFSKEAGLTREKQMRNTSYGKKAFVMYQWRYTDVFPLFKEHQTECEINTIHIQMLFMVV